MAEHIMLLECEPLTRCPEDDLSWLRTADHPKRSCTGCQTIHPWDAYAGRRGRSSYAT